VSANLTAAQADIDLGSTVTRTLAYNDQVPGPLIHAAVGDELAVGNTFQVIDPDGSP